MMSTVILMINCNWIIHLMNWTYNHIIRCLDKLNLYLTIYMALGTSDYDIDMQHYHYTTANHSIESINNSIFHSRLIFSPFSPYRAYSPGWHEYANGIKADLTASEIVGHRFWSLGWIVRSLVTSHSILMKYVSKFLWISSILLLLPLPFDWREHGFPTKRGKCNEEIHSCVNWLNFNFAAPSRVLWCFVFSFRMRNASFVWWVGNAVGAILTLRTQSMLSQCNEWRLPMAKNRLRRRMFFISFSDFFPSHVIG